MKMQILCRERPASVMRTVETVDRDPDEVQELVTRARQVPNMFDGQELSWLNDDQTVLFRIDDVGVAASGRDLVSGVPHVHVTFWDRRLRGREDLCRALCMRLMHYYGTELLYTVIPADRPAVRAFARRIGFVDGPTEGLFLLYHMRLTGH